LCKIVFQFANNKISVSAFETIEIPALLFVIFSNSEGKKLYLIRR